MVVIEFAKSGRAACKTCSGHIAEGTMKLGTAINNDGYLNMEWHHARCFWTRRAARYYKRKGKKANTLLRLQQFSGQQLLDATQLQELSDKILECNQRWGTKEALEAEGIPVLARDEEKEEAEKKEKAEKRKLDKMEKAKEEAAQPRTRMTRSSQATAVKNVDEVIPANSKRRRTTK